MFRRYELRFATVPYLLLRLDVQLWSQDEAEAVAIKVRDASRKAIDIYTVGLRNRFPTLAALVFGRLRVCTFSRKFRVLFGLWLQG